MVQIFHVSQADNHLKFGSRANGKPARSGIIYNYFRRNSCTAYVQAKICSGLSYINQLVRLLSLGNLTIASTSHVQ